MKTLKNQQLLTVVNITKLSQKDRSQYKHNYFNWTTSYDNACSIYYNNKNKSEWFLKIL